MAQIRLDKLLSEAGFCSKKRAKQFLNVSKVLVNGVRILEPGLKVDSDVDQIVVNGTKVQGVEEKVYYLLNKPKGVVVTVSDELNRPTVVSLIPEKKRIFPVGRLDENTSGLIILTNDGEFSNKLTHPSFHIPKTYELTIQGYIPKPALAKLKNGVELSDGVTLPALVPVVQKGQNQTIIELVLFEGRNRQIRRMCGKLKLELLNLRRVAIGKVSDNNLVIGKYRKLTAEEVEVLKEADE